MLEWFYLCGASLVWPSIIIAFKNDTAFDAFIHASVVDVKLTVDAFGQVNMFCVHFDVGLLQFFIIELVNFFDCIEIVGSDEGFFKDGYFFSHAGHLILKDGDFLEF